MIKKTIKIPLFWKIYITVVTIVLIGFVVLWSILWTALKKYEQSRPEYAMDKVIEQIQLQDTGDFTKYVHTGENAYEGSEALDEAVREYIKNVLCEGEWTYTKKSGEYTNDNPVYQLKKDGQKTDIIIYLEKNSKNEWTIADVSGLSCEGKTYEIIVPENSEVTVDGNKLGSEYVTETKDAEVLSNVAKHINMPKTTTYHIENVYKEHEIKATGPVYNSELELISSTDNVYEFGFEANSKLIEDYVTKPFPMSVFQKKLAVVLGRLTKQHGGDTYEDGTLTINFSEMSAALSGKPLTFTPLEYRLLKILMKNPQIVLTRQVLLEKLWDADGNFVDEHALTAAISRVRNKIETPDRQYIKTVYGMGYMWIGGALK